MKNGIHTRLLLSLFLIGMMACESHDGNTYATLSIRSAGPAESRLKAAATQDLAFDSAVIVLEKIELKRLEEQDEPDQAEVDPEYNYYGPFVIDLIRGISRPDIPSAEVKPGLYTKFEAEMAYFPELGFSFYLYGSFETDSGMQEFEYYYQQTEDFKAEKKDGFEIAAGETNNILVEIDLAALFDGVDLRLADKDHYGIIRLNKRSNRDLADLIESNLETASELGLDEDGNGEIDE